MVTSQVRQFIKESNKIEGILREPTEGEVEEFLRFMELDKVTVEELEKFVAVYQPGAQLRDRVGLNVRVGTYYPPLGGPFIRVRLQDVLDSANLNQESGKMAYEVHQKYESLHPFTDGNGRSGRMLWMWMIREAPLGFLHTWYYQSLSNSRVKI